MTPSPENTRFLLHIKQFYTGRTFVNMDSLHPGHGTCFHDSIWHRDGVDSVHDTLGEESIKYVNVTFVLRKNVKNTSILDI